MAYHFSIPDTGNLSNFLGPAAIISIACLALILILKIEQIRRLKIANNKLKKSLTDMDEQAKLIMRTDLELNKTQEELDRKIDSLYALQKISQALSTTLAEEQIFSCIDAVRLEEMGFEKCLILVLDKLSGARIVKQKLGFTQSQVQALQTEITEHVINALVKYKNILYSLKPQDEYNSIYLIMNELKITSFIIAPIPIREESAGVIIVANESAENVLTEGNQEIVAILGSQIGRTLENAKLFTDTWKSRQELEKRVLERTEELRKTLEEIKQISKRKTDFVYAVSHELRTPLTSIKGYASLLASEKLGAVPQPVKERLEKINQHSDELTKFINNLLDIYRIESKSMEMKLEPQNISSILANIADMLSPQLKEKEIKLTLDIPADLPAVMADHGQLERVLINLLSNAMKFASPNGEITIKAKQDGGHVRADICDTGIGISEKDIKHIFDEFYRVDNPINQEVKGTGLGLSLVKSIIEAHKGKIWAQSMPNKGSTFSFELPAAGEVKQNT